MSQPKPKAGYQSDDREVLLGAYKWLFWRWMILLVPRWIAPNALTIFGNLAVMASVPAMLLGTSGRPGFFLVSAICVFVYITLDNLDGAHARRTGRASRLGELLDHGLDGLASGSMLLGGAIAIHLDAVFTTALVVFGTCAYVLCMWEQYRTNVLVIPAVSGTEGATMIMGLGIIDFAFDDPPFMHFDTSQLSISTAIMIFVVVGYAAALVPPIIRSHKAGAHIAELLPSLLLTLWIAALAATGANPLVTGTGVAFLGSDIGVRLIRLRQSEREAPILSRTRWALAVPMVVALIARDPNVSEVAAYVTTGGTALSFLTGMFQAGRRLA